MIKVHLTSSISPEFYSRTNRGVLQLGIRAELQSSIPLGHAFFTALINFTFNNEKSIQWGSVEYVYGLSAWPRLACSRENIGLSIKDPFSFYIT
jgi:hypothetical protein